MIRLFFIFFLALSLVGASLGEQIQKLNRQIPYATKGETVQILHALENDYISAVIKQDKDLIRRALRGIIRCRKLLHLDAKTYEREYASLTKGKSRVAPLSRVKASKRDSVSITPKSPTVLAPQSPPRKIRSLSVKERTIVVKFDKKITGNGLIFYDNNDPHKKHYKRIYDIKAKALSIPTTLSIASLDRVRIEPKGTITRIVLENKKPIMSKAFIRGGNLFIKVNNRISKETKREYKAHVADTKRAPNHQSTTIVIPSKKREVSKKAMITSKPITSYPIYADSKLIVIDPGHGGKDSGAVGYKNHYEKRAVLKVAKLLKHMLKKKGYRVYLTREGDQFISLHERTHKATKLNADLFISIHANAAPKGKMLSMKGIETFFLSKAKTERAKRVAAKENAAASSLDRKSKNLVLDFLNSAKIVQSNKLAIDIQSGLLEATRAKFRGVKDGGVREAPFWVLVGAQMPAVLVEIGYITNPMEGDRLYNPFYQKALAKGIFNGINNYFAKNR